MGNHFWDSPKLEPKRNFRFIMRIGNVSEWLIKTTGRPNFEISQATHSYLNHTFKFPGKVTWQDIDVSLVDPIDDNSLAKMKTIIFNSGYSWMEPQANPAAGDHKTISKAKAVEALNGTGESAGLVIHQIDADGNTIETWTLYNAWISKVSPNELSYEDENLSDITLTITYDFAKLEVKERKTQL